MLIPLVEALFGIPANPYRQMLYPAELREQRGSILIWRDLVVKFKVGEAIKVGVARVEEFSGRSSPFIELA